MSDATFNPTKSYTLRLFQSTHRVSDATASDAGTNSVGMISIHAPRERCDNLTLSLRRRCGISIHALRERCDRIQPFPYPHKLISIHAPRERCDKSNVYRYPRSLSISIHAPLERCDQILFTANTTTPISIHVPLARYDALGMATVDGEIADFNPHTARAV